VLFNISLHSCRSARLAVCESAFSFARLVSSPLLAVSRDCSPLRREITRSPKGEGRMQSYDVCSARRAIKFLFFRVIPDGFHVNSVRSPVLRVSGRRDDLAALFAHRLL